MGKIKAIYNILPPAPFQGALWLQEIPYVNIKFFVFYHIL